jgi:tRNA(Arg) A34 adenosine deaminase TadA
MLFSCCVEELKTKEMNEGVAIDESMQQPLLSASAADLRTLLQTIEQDIVPKTRNGVKNGNKVFGAAILDSELDLIIAETNNEIVNPLFHGEINLINEWSKVTTAAERGPDAQKSVFLSTHEPCCMCIR